MQKEGKDKKGKLPIWGLIGIVVFLLLVVDTEFGFDPPDGYTEKHHSYNDMVEYARRIDPQATVSPSYSDIKAERGYRIWPAVINGIECNVASASTYVWKRGPLGELSEVAKKYYIMDTDYDYYVIRDILKNHEGLGVIEDDSVDTRFHTNDLVCSKVTIDKMTTDQLEQLWNEYVEMNRELEDYPLHKAFWLQITISDYPYFFTEPTEECYKKEYDRMVENGALH